jgi:hypothetical protein
VGFERDTVNTREHWKATLLTVSDSAFFEIMRNYLGDLRTPFNKHDLIARLDAFLRDESVTRGIASLIDAEEAKIVTAIAMLDGPTLAELHRFELGGGNYADLHYAILNLEDRLVIYEDEDGRLWVTPHLAETLGGSVIHPGRLFPSVPVEEAGPGLPWLGDVFLVSLLSFLLEEPELFRSDGELRKRAEAELSARFPQVFGDAAGNRRWAIVVSMLESLGLAVRSDSKLLPRHGAWRELADLPRESRLNFCWSCALQSLGWGGDRGAERLAGLLEALPGDRALSADAIRRLISYSSADETASDDEILEVLCDLGLLVERDEGWYHRNSHLDELFGSGRDGESACILQPNFELTVKPWIDLDVGVTVAYISELVQFDTYPRFEITKTSVSRALAGGFDTATLRDEIRALAGDSLPQNIRFSIEDWSREYESIQLYEGTVLVVDEARRHLIDHSDEVQGYVHRKLAEGVYLMREGYETALVNAGVELVPQVQRVTVSRGGGHRWAKSLRHFHPQRLPVRIETSEPPSLADGSQKLDLKEQIESSSLNADLKDDLRQRLKRKLIVHPDQVSTANSRREKVEARGLDYLGKVKLIQQTVSSKSYHLEVVARDKKGAPLRYLVRPSRVDKTGKELLLVGNTIPDGEEIQLPVSKLSLVRKLRGTFFER